MSSRRRFRARSISVRPERDRGRTRPVDFDLNGVATCDIGAEELQ